MPLFTGTPVRLALIFLTTSFVQRQFILSTSQGNLQEFNWTYNTKMTSSIDALMTDFGALLTEVETLLQRANNASGATAETIQTEVETKLQAAKQRMLDLEGTTADAAKAVKQATEDYVHQNPWQSIGIAAAVGFLAGIVLSRR